jgi:hypothetical protein
VDVAADVATNCRQSDVTVMRFLPQTKSDWGRFVLFPFKAYVVIAWPITLFIAQAGGRAARELPLDLVWLGYHLCFWILLCGGLIQLSHGRRSDTIVTFIFAALALLVVLPLRIL